MEPLLHMKQLEKKLQQADRKHSRLYLFCNFIASMIISAYSALMYSKTVQTVFPIGGDSRKQMYAIFVMALVGCVVFTIYASQLFFRHKSRQLGILMALGASKKYLAHGLFREVFFLSSFSIALGVLAGFPFVRGTWSLFRLTLVDSPDMALTFDFRCLFVSLAFSLLTIGFSCFQAWRYVKKKNIMETIHEEHMNEPVKELGKWCGPAGFLMILASAVIGYLSPLGWERLFQSYPPFWLQLFYMPIFAGLYMIMLHTVTHGWKSNRKTPYKNIISRSIMKFQAKQTVNSLIITTLLVAGASFAIFYPATGIPTLLGYSQYPYDYFYQYRADQKGPEEETVRELAKKYKISLKDWGECEYISLGIGQSTTISEDNKHFRTEYVPIQGEAKMLSEDSYLALTGESVDVRPGTYLFITNEDETNFYANESAKDLTNMVTRKQAATQFAGYLHYDLLSDDIGYYVLDPVDYQALAEGLTEEWKGKIIRFNVDGEDSYEFANALYRLFVSSFDESCEHVSFYNRVSKIMENEAGKTYWMDTELGEEFELSYDNPDSLSFRSLWAYRPSFRILLTNDYLRTIGVLFVMFLFIFIVCLITALIINYTRCQTIVLNNRYLFDNLKKLGASPHFLSKEIKKQCSHVFKVPASVGMASMYLLFTLILYANDGKITSYEAIALLICLILLIIISLIHYAIYRITVDTMKKQLKIQ